MNEKVMTMEDELKRNIGWKTKNRRKINLKKEWMKKA